MTDGDMAATTINILSKIFSRENSYSVENLST